VDNLDRADEAGALAPVSLLVAVGGSWQVPAVDAPRPAGGMVTTWPGSLGKPVADAFTRAAADPLRPARVFASAFALGAAVFLIAAVVAAVSAAGVERELVAHATGSTLTLPDAPARDLVLYAATPDGGEPSDDLLCRLQTDGSSRAGYAMGTGTFDVDGRTLHRTGTLRSGWRPADTVTCDGVAELAAVTRDGPLKRLALAGMLGFGAVLCSVLAIVGRRSRRARRPSLAG
jgi:hypothetical protein